MAGELFVSDNGSTVMEYSSDEEHGGFLPAVGLREQKESERVPRRASSTIRPELAPGVSIKPVRDSAKNCPTGLQHSNVRTYSAVNAAGKPFDLTILKNRSDCILSKKVSPVLR